MSALLTVEGLRHGFYGVQVLNGASFEVRQGTVTGLIGPNGAGKSTAINAISGALLPQGGRVSFAGTDITRLPPRERVGLGLVRSFQLARGFPRLSVFDHLMLYGQGHPGEGFWQSLTGGRAGRQHEERLAETALSVARRLKLDHVIDNPVSALSGGQKKLVEIGRALMAEPRMILFDEPMAGVNPTLSAQIAEHLTALNEEGITICLIEHDMAMVARLCDPVIVMAEGRKMTEGSFAEVVADKAVQEAYLGVRHDA
ncbi:ABC transporter ATP-binding protein [Mangrovicoccus sp. HB161399]|uniref:ABC transporter ATP-binding protein n=1 Tax=Mangrovicoccus sp. HB161399 TaxID=2720392 RepID=UPI001556FD32|nr:ABC transporter ATP-binding protein [Mangrovicoccus sp. HB161399]